MKTSLYCIKKSFHISLIIFCSLFFSKSANGAIVYTDISPDSLFILQEVPFQSLSGSQVPIDFNNDLIVDCSFSWSTLVGGFAGDDWAVSMEPGDNITTQFSLDISVPIVNNFYFVNMLDSGDLIDGSGDWTSISPRLGDENEGHLANQGIKYIGAKIMISGVIHYGWIKVSVSSSSTKSVTVLGYAYETVALAPILAGATSGSVDILVASIEVYSLSGDTVIGVIGDSLQMVANVLPLNATDASYLWSINNLTGVASIDASGNLIGLSNGTVEVFATANDLSGISGSTIILIEDSAMSTIEWNDNSVEVYPNPSSGEVIVQAEDRSLSKLRVYTQSGLLLANYTLQESQYKVNLSGLAKGVYLLQIEDENGSVKHERIILK